MKAKLLTLSLFFSFGLSFTQGVTVGTNNAPDPSAVLDVQSSTRGFLLPRMTTSQRNAIVSPAIGLEIFNTTTNCLQMYLPQSNWRDIVCDCANPPSAAFTVNPASPNVNQATQFSATSGGLNYQWTFPSGSPNSGNTQNVSVTWANAGTYTVTLTVTDNAGCSTTSTQQIVVNTCNYVPGTTTLAYTGGSQTFTVPACVTLLTIEAWGANGANGNNGNLGGLGGYAKGDLVVSPGQVLNVYVGQAGAGNSGSCVQTSGPRFNGGGAGNCASSGGGASDVRVGGTALTDRIIVAGGGGGSAFYATNGGAGGGTNGTAGGNNITSGATGGGGGSQGAGGAGGNSGGTAGVLGNGGTGGGTYGGGGGGGYYGGGGGGGEPNGQGQGGSGGGGSSYVGGVTNSSTQTGIWTGNGQVKFTW